jgi:phospholipid-binding lipoprotein MlaA
MRLNGLSFALASLLAPAAVFAQATPAADASTPAETAPAAETAAASPAVTSLAGSASDSPVESATANAIGTPGTTSGPVGAEAEAASEPLPQEVRPSDTGATESAVDATATGEEPITLSNPDDVERAFQEIYGPQDYDPLADPTLPEPAVMPGTYDPWEKYNRNMHRFNNAVDRGVARPLARGYVKVVPRPVRLGVSNFFTNLGQPLTMVNSLLQGKPKQAGQALGRFLLNSTFGIAGIFDPATRANLPQKSEDFGQTLGVWGWKRSRYFELPLFGPRTVRDVFGMGGDAPLSPLRGVEADRIRIPLQSLQLVDMRSQLLATDSLREGAQDDYTLVRDAWSQRRDYQIFGDRQRNGEDLPDYLLDEETDSTVPVDAMPVIVPEGP